MVLEEGKKNGTGIWEIDGYEKIEKRIRNIVKDYISSEVDENINLERILIVGSYGSGMGVKGKSDLDIVILVDSTMPIRSTEYSQIMRDIAGKVNYNEKNILKGFSEFTGLESYVYPFLEREKHLVKLCRDEPVEEYYNLTEDRKESYY